LSYFQSRRTFARIKPTAEIEPGIPGVAMGQADCAVAGAGDRVRTLPDATLGYAMVDSGPAMPDAK
jgi:hypothetical protein